MNCLSQSIPHMTMSCIVNRPVFRTKSNRSVLSILRNNLYGAGGQVQQGHGGAHHVGVEVVHTL